ncbi:MAG: hypothetical protein ACM3Q1_01315 [Bacteroidales bacterium]
MLVWIAPAVAAEQGDIERGRRQLMETLYDVVYLSNANERMVRWKVLPKVMLVNASPEEFALTRDKIHQFSESFGTAIAFTEDPTDAGIIIFFIDSYRDVSNKYVTTIERHFGDEDFQKALPKLLADLAVWKFPFLVEINSRGGVETATGLVFIKADGDSRVKSVSLINGLAISFGMRGNTGNYSIRNVGASEDLTDLDNVLLKFMYLLARPGMSWPDAKAKMDQMMDQVFGRGR